MKIKLMGKFLKILTAENVVAITLCPFGIYFRDSVTMENKYTVNHESIHWKQQLEMLIIFFYLWYGIEYVIRLISGSKDPYMALTFEKEAYANENNLDYLKTRKHFSWIKYL